ncbi:MAG: DUF695 domain-containing protein [Planctomycetes bacterium]|nr:DUF695 domain-containing protein [Planctomycetota bacterium]
MIKLFRAVLLLVLSGMLVSCQKQQSSQQPETNTATTASGQSIKIPSQDRKKEEHVKLKWFNYMTEIDNESSSVTVDASIGQHILENMPHLLILRMQAKELRENGFPSKEDYNQAYALEDDFEKELDVSEIRFVGRITTKGAYFFYLYSSKPESHGKRVIEMAKAFGRTVSLETREDKNWSTYKEQLYPSPDAWRQITDKQILDVLKKRGDDLTKPRQIDHWLYFKSANARDAVADRLTVKGFKIVDRENPAKSGEDWGLHVCRVDSVQPQEITKLTVSLMHLAAEHGGEYDGWETSVEK